LDNAANEPILDDLLTPDAVTAWVDSAWAWVQINLLSFEVLLQLLLVLGALVPAVVFGPRLRHVIRARLAVRVPVGAARRLVNAFAELATPIALYLILNLVRVALASLGHPLSWVAATIALMNAWILVRMVTLVIQSEFWSRVAFYIAWPIAALDAFGALGPVIEQLRALAIPLGQSGTGEPQQITLLDILRTLFYFALLFWSAHVVSRFLQGRIQAAEELSPSLKTLLAKTLNVIFPIVALVVALQIAGFNLATLAVFSGAVGLGIGLGLQRIAANFIAGFTLIVDKSIKPYDVIEIDGTFGWVTSMQARYVALRTRDGTEILIPNDRFMSEGVVNWSRSDRIVRMHAPFGVSYRTEDLRLVQRLATESAAKVPRVLAAPAPVCNLTAFGDSSVDFDLRFWIEDPQNGMANVRSDVLMNVWDALKANGIEIPFPQRDLHLKTWPASLAVSEERRP